MAGNMGRATAWRLERAGDFPPPVKISPGRVAWRESDILAWQASRGAKMEAAA
jgi:predicted DNA-binding transcriptional regulator AlpA